MNPFSGSKDVYLKKAEESWLKAVIEVSKLEEKLKWLKNLEKSIAEDPEETAENASPRIMTPKNSLDKIRMMEIEDWEPTPSAWMNPKALMAEQTITVSAMKELSKTASAEVTNAVDITRNWLVALVEKHRSHYFGHFPKVLSELVEVYRHLYSVREKITIASNDLVFSNDLIDAAKTFEELGKMIENVKKWFVNEVRMLKKSHPHELPKDLSKAIEIFGSWFEAQKKTELLAKFLEITKEGEVTREDISMIIKMAEEIFEFVTQVETASREATGLSPRHVYSSSSHS
jgi:hypothetical protein